MLHVPDNDGPNLLLSIPRDSFVDDPRAWREQDQRRLRLRRVRSCSSKTVEQNTGVRIDNYVEIGFAGFVDVVDAVGGITICPESADQRPEGRATSS